MDQSLVLLSSAFLTSFGLVSFFDQPGKKQINQRKTIGPYAPKNWAKLASLKTSSSRTVFKSHWRRHPSPFAFQSLVVFWSLPNLIIMVTDLCYWGQGEDEKEEAPASFRCEQKLQAEFHSRDKPERNLQLFYTRLAFKRAAHKHSVSCFLH